jgi:hypothetical protein
MEAGAAPMNGTLGSESQVSLARALRTLSGIRERYQLGRYAHPDLPFFRVQVVVDGGDVAWITATIETLEKVIAAVASETVAAEAQARRDA